MRGGLPVFCTLQLAVGHRLLDEQRPLAHVSPCEGKRLLRTRLRRPRTEISVASRQPACSRSSRRAAARSSPVDTDDRGLAPLRRLVDRADRVRPQSLRFDSSRCRMPWSIAIDSDRLNTDAVGLQFRSANRAMTRGSDHASRRSPRRGSPCRFHMRAYTCSVVRSVVAAYVCHHSCVNSAERRLPASSSARLRRAVSWMPVRRRSRSSRRTGGSVRGDQPRVNDAAGLCAPVEPPRRAAPGRRRLRDLTPRMIARFRADLESDGIGVEAIRKTMAMLQGILQRAVEWQRLRRNPARRPQAAERRQRASCRSRRRRRGASRRAAPGRPVRDATLVSVLAYAGLRPQEALALAWGHVRERTLLVEQAVTDGELKGPKTGKPPRTVTLLGPLKQDLAEWRLRQGRPPTTEFVFPAADGRRGASTTGATGAGARSRRRARVRHRSSPRRTTCATRSRRC